MIGLLGLIALAPSVESSLLGLTALQVEGYVLVLLLLVGVLFAWLLFTEPVTVMTAAGADGNRAP